MGEHRVDLPLPLPSPDLLAPSDRAWYDQQTPDVQESLRRMAVQTVLHGGGSTDVALERLIAVTAAYRGAPVLSDQPEQPR